MDKNDQRRTWFNPRELTILEAAQTSYFEFRQGRTPRQGLEMRSEPDVEGELGQWNLFGNTKFIPPPYLNERLEQAAANRL